MRDHKELKDKQGRYRTVSLFWELRHDGLDPVYSLKDYDHEVAGKVYPSLKQIYLSYDHVVGAEYDFAMETLGSWKHWQKLNKSAHLRTYINEWKEELEIKNKANALRGMMIAAKDNDAKGVNAAKYLAEKGYESKKGRPSKADVERETKLQAGANKDLEADMARLGMKVVEGGK